MNYSSDVILGLADYNSRSLAVTTLNHGVSVIARTVHKYESLWTNTDDARNSLYERRNALLIGYREVLIVLSPWSLTKYRARWESEMKG